MARGGKRQGAGRKKGQAALAAEEYRKFIVEEVRKNKKEIVAAQITKAKQGDTQAFKELNDRALGKAPQGIDLTSKGEQIGKVVMLPERKEDAPIVAE
jgi:hypothetical protein